MNKTHRAILTILISMLMVFVIAVPQASAAKPPQMDGNWCGVMAYCARFNRQDQVALHTGGAAAVGVALCGSTRFLCPAAGIIIPVAVIYLEDKGYCKRYLWVRYTWVPSPHAYGWCG